MQEFNEKFRDDFENAISEINTIRDNIEQMPMNTPICVGIDQADCKAIKIYAHLHNAERDQTYYLSYKVIEDFICITKISDRLTATMSNYILNKENKVFDSKLEDSYAIQDVKRVMMEFVENPKSKIAKYITSPLNIVDMQKDKVVPYSYIQRRCINLRHFKNQGKDKLKYCLEQICKEGFCSKLDREQSDFYGTSGVLYGVLK